jgi:hypothetical protein
MDQDAKINWIQIFSKRNDNKIKKLVNDFDYTLFLKYA